VGASYAYKQFSRGIATGLGTRLSTFFPDKTWAFFTTYGVGYRFSLIRIEGGRNYYYRNTNSQLTSTLNQTLTYNTVNHPFKPTSGQKIGLGFEYGGWQFGTDSPFYRTTLEYERVGSLADRHIFALNTSFGFMKNLGNGDLPVWDLYRPGGENSIRGYRFGQVGSVRVDNNLQQVVVGGTKQFIANLEYQFKIADQFRLVFFHDAGNAWGAGTKVFSRDPVTYLGTNDNLPYTYRNPSLVRSAGVEFRFFLPISPAPLRLIWSRKINPYPFDTESKTDFQFSIGTTF
jgi:outer membrane protein insertion porin family